MGTLSIWHWLIVLVIVMLIFGTRKLRNIGEDLGGAVKGFKEGMKNAEHDASPNDNPSPQLAGNGSQASPSTPQAAREVR